MLTEQLSKYGGKLNFLNLGSRRGKDAARFYPVTKDPRSQVNFPYIMENNFSVGQCLVSIFDCSPSL